MKYMGWAVLALTLVACVARGDSLFTRASEERGTLISNKKPIYEVGDIITVMVRESIDATTESTTNTKKESDISAQADASDNEFLVANGPGGLNIMPPERLPNWAIEVGNEHKGKGTTERSNKLIMTVSCTVTHVADNGNLTIEGEKAVTVNREESQISLRGTVRARDVTASNTVESYQIANADIKLKGRGPLWNNERRGLITKLLDWFSPF